MRVTSCPRARSSRVTADPMSPVEPVIANRKIDEPRRAVVMVAGVAATRAPRPRLTRPAPLPSLALPSADRIVCRHQEHVMSRHLRRCLGLLLLLAASADALRAQQPQWPRTFQEQNNFRAGPTPFE